MFAIVKFVEEEDAPGVVSTNWINSDKDICWYPNVRSEDRKNKLLFTRAPPKPDWIQCPIKVLKQFSNYTEAKSALSEAECTSHLESEDCQRNEPKVRKRKQRVIRLPGEESSSSGDENAATTSQKSVKKKHLSRHLLKNLSAPPKPPSHKPQIHAACSTEYNSTDFSRFLSEGQPPSKPFVHEISNEIEIHTSTADNSTDLSRFLSENQPPSRPFVHERSNEIEKNIVKAQTAKKTQKINHGFASSTFLGSDILPQTYAANEHESAGEESDSLLRGLNANQHFLKPFNWQRNSDIEKQKDEEIRKLKANQIEMWSALGQLTDIAKSNSEKLNTILLKLEQFQSNKVGSGTEELQKMINLLPVKVEDFKNLVETIKRNNSFRQSLLQILMASSGKDPKAMVSSMLRKLITDDVGEKFSLTGKILKGGATKESFEKTALYKLITEACFRVHQDVKENVIREGISDWLMQSKFRKNRREQRKNQSREDTADDFDINSLFKNQ